VNCYSSLPATKRAIKLAAANTDFDTLLLELLESASRKLDAFCRRQFWTGTATRDFYPHCSTSALIDDLLSVVAVSKVDPEDSTVDPVVYPATAYRLDPLNSYPKLKIALNANATEYLVAGTNCLRIQGEWGYVDGRADPWALAGANVTVATTTGTTITLSAAGS